MRDFEIRGAEKAEAAPRPIGRQVAGDHRSHRGIAAHASGSCCGWREKPSNTRRYSIAAQRAGTLVEIFKLEYLSLK
jgi:hypothetical protein